MDRSEHLMTVFAEELGEVAMELLDLQKQIFKAQRFGVDECRDLPTTNRERIEAEWQDLLGAVEKLREVGIELRPNIEAINAKMDKVERYCGYAESLGTLST